VVWGEEVAMFTFIWLAFLAASVAVRRKAHFRMSALLVLFPAKVRAALEVGALVIMGILTAILAWHGIPFLLGGLKEQAPGLRIPMAWVYAALPISGISMLVFLAEAILEGPPSSGAE
jgi:TRAP-type C4-dicarboxylate transport system permease small subunit